MAAKEVIRARADQILKILAREYPEAKCSLIFKNAFELLCATILSAQCTDERVNKVTPALFKKYPTPQEMGEAPVKEIEKLVQSTGFYKNKAKSLKECSQALCVRHGGEVPSTIEELVGLRGVGRKTANVVLGNIFGIQGVVVDTHVGRLARRMGFTKQKDPVKVEFELQKVFPKEKWTLANHWLIDHGRAVCTARKPKCEDCSLKNFCPKMV